MTWVRQNLLIVLFIISITAVLIELLIARRRASRRKSTVHRQDGLYSAANRNELLELATRLREAINLSSRVDRYGDGDIYALTVNTLVNRAVPGAVWDEKEQRYLVREKPHVHAPGPPAPPRNPRDRMTG